MGNDRGRPVGTNGNKAAALRKVYDDLEAAGRIDDAKVQTKLYELACAGDVGAIREYNDRRYGRPPASLEVDSTVRMPVIVSPGQLTREEWRARYSGADAAPFDEDDDGTRPS